MSKVSLITPAQERTLSDALVSAIKRANAGDAPNEALAKSASEYGLTPQFACRMTEAYNASKTVKYLQSTEGEKRAQDFELADRDEVLRFMYNAEPKDAPAEKASVFALGKTYTLDRSTSKNVEKAASDKSATEADVVKQRGPALRQNKITKLSSMIDRLDRMGQEIRMELAHARDQVLKSACELEATLRIPGHESFEELERRVISTYGSMGKKAMDIVWGMSDFERLGEKRASTPDRLLIMGVGPEYSAARDLMSNLEKAARIDQEFQDWQKQRKQVQKLLPASSGQQPGGTGATFVSDPGMPRRPATAPLVDVAAAVGGVQTGKADSSYPVKEAAKSDKGILQDPGRFLSSLVSPGEPVSIFDPAHEAKLRSIRTRLVINDMISNDPVLSAYPPEQVFNAYNELARIAPGISNEPVVIRSLIGRTLQTGGRMEQNEIKQLLDTEKAHREIRVKGF